MSEILVDNLTGKTSAGDITVTSEGGSATMQLQQGVAKMWINGNFSTNATNDSLNISSFSDQAVGRFHLSPSNNMSNANSTLSGCGKLDDAIDDSNSVQCGYRRVSTAPISTSSIPVQFTYYGATGNHADPNIGVAIVHGDLA